jgi:hypothetical protein
MRFSQRIGKRPIKTVLQVDSMDGALRNRLWNNVHDDLVNEIPYDYPRLLTRIRVLKEIWKDFLVLPIDDIPMNDRNYILFVDYLREWFYKSEWDEVYDLIEYLLLFDIFTKRKFSSSCNISLSKEVSGYRILDSKIVQITSEEEIQAIEDALDCSDKFKPVNKHLKTALNLLADRASPDYRNSIKESISAVEAFCILIVGDSKANLGKALAIIESKHLLHSSLKEAYNKIYGYTSDADGIRHAMLEDGVLLNFEDAKFMLVSCSAFINYLQAKLKL